MHCTNLVPEPVEGNKKAPPTFYAASSRAKRRRKKKGSQCSLRQAQGPENQR